MTGFDGIERTERRWHQKLQVRKAVGGGAQNEDRNPSTVEILLVGDLLVGGDQDLEIGSFSRSKQCTILSNSRETKFLAFLQDLDGKLSADCGEAFQKFIERFTVLDIVEKRLHGDTGPAKYRCPMHHFGIACDDFLHDFIVAQNPGTDDRSTLTSKFRSVPLAVRRVRNGFESLTESPGKWAPCPGIRVHTVSIRRT